MITSADVLAIAPELQPTTTGQWSVFIADAYSILCAPALAISVGSKLDLAAKYLAAHFATIFTQVRPPYNQITRSTDVELESTPYGRQYKWIIRTTPNRWAITP